MKPTRFPRGTRMVATIVVIMPLFSCREVAVAHVSQSGDADGSSNNLPQPPVSPAPKSLRGQAVISGSVVFEGQPPARKRISLTTPAQLEMARYVHKPLVSDNVIVNANGTLKNVFVCVKKGLEGRFFACIIVKSP